MKGNHLPLALGLALIAIVSGRAQAQQSEFTMGVILLVDGDPLDDLELIADPEKNFLIIMNDGKIYKNTVK